MHSLRKVLDYIQKRTLWIETVISLIFFLGASICFGQGASPAPPELKKYLRTYVAQKQGDPSLAEYSFAIVDLNGKEKHTIVYLGGRQWCGSGGCTLLVLKAENGTYKKVSRMTITNLPIRVLDTQTNGWHDIGIRVRGGGILKAYEARMRYSGTKYPLNPSTAPKTSPYAPGDVAIPENAKPIPLAKP